MAGLNEEEERQKKKKDQEKYELLPALGEVFAEPQIQLEDKNAIASKRPGAVEEIHKLVKDL